MSQNENNLSDFQTFVPIREKNMQVDREIDVLEQVVVTVTGKITDYRVYQPIHGRIDAVNTWLGQHSNPVVQIVKLRYAGPGKPGFADQYVMLQCEKYYPAHEVLLGSCAPGIKAGKASQITAMQKAISDLKENIPKATLREIFAKS